MADIAELGYSIDSSQAATAADNLDKMSASSARAQTATERLQASTDAMGASARAYTAFGKEIQQFLESEARDLADVADRRYAYNQALQAGILTSKQYSSALQDLAKQEQALGAATSQTTNAHGVMLGSMKLTSFQMQEVGRIIKDLATGNYALLERTSLTLAASTGLLASAFSATGAAVALLAAPIVAAIAVVISAQNELDNYRKNLIATGQTQIETADQVRAAAEQVGAATGQYSAARTAMEALLATGKFIGDNLQTAAKGVVSFADLTGKSVDQAAKSFEKLLDEPVKASLALDQQFHYLSASELEQIANLQEMGDKAGAGALAIKDFADALTSRDQAYRQTLTGWRALWNDITTAIGGAADAAANFLLKQHAPGSSNVPWSGGGVTSGIVNNDLPAPGLFSDVRSEIVALTDAQRQQMDADRAAQQAQQDLAAAMQGADQVAKAYIATTSESTVKLDEHTKILQLSVGGHNAVAKVIVEHDKALNQLAQQYGLNSAAYKSASAAMEDEYQSALKSAKADDVAAAAKKNHSNATIELSAELAKWSQENDKLLATQDPLVKAQASFNEQMTKATEELVVMLGHGLKWADALQMLNERTDLLTEAENRSVAAFFAKNDVLDKMEQKYIDADAALGKYTNAEKATLEVDKAIRDTLQSLIDQYGENSEAVKAMRDILASHRDEVIQDIAAFKDHSDAVKRDADAAREWQQIWAQAGNGVAETFSKVLVEGGSLFGSLADLAKQTVEEIIAYFAKLAVINPILNSIFAPNGIVQGGFQLLPTLANAFGGTTALAQTGAALGDFNMGGYSGGAASASGLLGGLGSLFSVSKWVDYGKSLWSGFSNMLNGYSGTFNMGGFSGATPVTPGYGGYGSALGQGLGIAAGIYAGYNRAQNADGAFGKIGGGLAYGFGTYFAGAGLAAGGAALAGGAGLGAAASAGFAAIPVVGWIAIAAMLIDKFSGGNLFGTSFSPDGETKTNLALGTDGLGITNSYEEKKKSALFGGNKYRWVTADLSSDQVDYITQFNAAMDKVRESAATALGTSVAGIVTGAFEERWNKDGKVTEQISTVLGKTYSETMDKFMERIQAENVIAQIDISAGGAATKIADQYRSDADKLSQAAQFLLAAQTDINKQQALLGDGANLTDTANVVQQLAQSNETLVQTYQRLQQETQALQSSLDLTGANIGKTGADFVKFADAAATAAGGVQNLQSLMQTFAQAFYSADELAQQSMENTRKQADKALSALGLDPTESLADFRKAYEAALPSLTAEQLVQWQQAGVYLAQADAAQASYNSTLKNNAISVQQLLDQLNPDRANKYSGTWQATLDSINSTFDGAIDKLKSYGATADQIAEAEADRQLAIVNAQKSANDNYDNIVKQITDGMASLSGTQNSLRSALDTIANAEKSTIDQLNAAAIAAGRTGAAESDLALVREYAAQQGVAAMKAFEDQTAKLAATLYGTNVDQLTKQLTDLQAKQAQATKDSNYALELFYANQIPGLQKQIDDANAQAAAAQRLSDATSLLSNLGQIGSITGASLDELAKQFSIPLDNFAKDLGLNSTSDLDRQFQQAELQASAAIQANDYLRQILDTLQGKTAPTITASGVVIGSKPDSSNNQSQTDAKLDAINKTLQTILQNGPTEQTQRDILTATRETAQTNRQMAQQPTNAAPIGNRNTRTWVPDRVMA